MKQKTVQLTNTQILNLPIAAIQLLSAPGANSIIVPVFAAMRLSIPNGPGFAYGNISANAVFGVILGNLPIAPDTPRLSLLKESSFAVSSVFANIESRGVFLPAEGSLDIPNSDLVPNSSFGDVVSVNRPLNMVFDNGFSGALVGGDASNTMIMTIIYSVLTF